MGRYTNIEELFTNTGKRFKGTTKYPDIPLSFDDIYVYTDEGNNFVLKYVNAINIINGSKYS